MQSEGYLFRVQHMPSLHRLQTCTAAWMLHGTMPCRPQAPIASDVSFGGANGHVPLYTKNLQHAAGEQEAPWSSGQVKLSTQEDQHFKLFRAPIFEPGLVDTPRRQPPTTTIDDHCQQKSTRRCTLPGGELLLPVGSTFWVSLFTLFCACFQVPFEFRWEL